MKHLASIALVAALASSASADKADKLFQKAKKLHADKKFAEACPTYEQVDKTDPAIGSKLDVAKCYEDWGRLATAYIWYVQADKMAKDAKDARGAQIKKLIEELDLNVPRIIIKTPEGADPDVLDTLTLDGQPIAEEYLNTEQRIDPGPHVIEFVVDGQKKKKMAPVERGGESELSLDIPKGLGKKPRPKKGGETPGVIATPDPGKARRWIGIGLGGAGVVAVGVAMGMTLSARGDYNDAIDAHCMGSPTMCNAEGFAITRDARKMANVSTVVTIVGVAAIAGGAFLYFTAPKKPAATEKQVYVTPTLDSTGGGFVVGGIF
jgi:tetratricopeptide (TPR) repeat protein